MATFQAIGSVAEAVACLLTQACQSSPLNDIGAQFKVYQGKDFATSAAQTQITTGVSVFVYQVSVNKVQRTLPPSTPQHRRPLPLDVWLLLTAWARDASTEHTILGWAMRTIDDNPILSSGFLNAAVPEVFLPQETVELVPAELTNAEIFQLWQVLPNSLQLSVPYVARVVRVESELTVPQGSPVMTRELEFGALPT